VQQFHPPAQFNGIDTDLLETEEQFANEEQKEQQLGVNHLEQETFSMQQQET